jgi:hypothetical protein
MNKLTQREAILKWQRHVRVIQSYTNVNPFESFQEKQERIEKARYNFAFFVQYYFPHYAEYETPDFHVSLAKYVKTNKVCNVIVRWGRGLAKSVICNNILPLWLWINGESIYMVVIGNNEDKAKILLGDLQAEFEGNERLINDFGKQVTAGSWTNGYFVCKDRFVAKALGMGQDARGLRKGAQRPNYINADDLEDKDTLKNPKRQDEIARWIARSVIPTMDGPVRRFLHSNNNFAPRTIQEELYKTHPSWKMHRVDACPGSDRKPTWWQKYPGEYYKEIERDLGTIALESEYNNTPFVEGNVFTADMIQWAKPPRWDHFKMIVGRWDPAYSGKNDYNAVRVWGLHNHNLWLMKAFVRQCKMGEAIRWIYAFEKSLPEGVIIHWKVESQFWNDPLRDALKEVEKEMKRPLNIIVVPSSKVKKLDRLLSMHPYYQNSRIYWNEKEKANNDMQVGLSQLLGIEPGYRTHDDAPDADERAISDLIAADRSMSFEPSIGNKYSTNHSW